MGHKAKTNDDKKPQPVTDEDIAALREKLNGMSDAEIRAAYGAGAGPHYRTEAVSALINRQAFEQGRSHAAGAGDPHAKIHVAPSLGSCIAQQEHPPGHITTDRESRRMVPTSLANITVRS